MSTPYSRSASVSWMQANSSSLGISRRAPSISVTWLPSVWNACESSTPTTPPPSTTRRSGISCVIVASRFVHAQSNSCRPGIGGIAGPEPVARKTARLASISSSPTITRRSPESRPWPRISSIPRSSSHGSCASSSRSWMISSRRASTAATSSLPVTASAAPGIRLTSASAS